MDKRPTLYERLHECLGQVISQRRKRLGMSQEELAEHAGVDRAFISSVERSKRNPSFRTVARIAHGLRMKLARLADNCERCAEAESGKSA